ncbi:hypothetical protein B0O99DRAFT_514279 [Bisporella sp. PMI_857]|nr:hypothetical protein B0O99DRAFT_514279 [Bisporella sp. PMI_857]
MLSKLVTVVALLAASVSAQTAANSTIDPSTVDLTTRAQWCGAQQNTCGTLCSGAADPNTCDENTLTFNCTCTANNSSPGLIYYKQTLPTFICQQIYEVCIKNGENVAAAQKKCTDDRDKNCGTLDPEKFVASSSSSSGSASATSTPTGTAGSAGSVTTTASSSSSTGAAATMMAVAGSYGSGMLAAGVVAAFGLVL